MMNAARLDLKKRLNTVFAEVFNDEGIEIFEEMTARDLDTWDSLRHITLVVAVEKEFGLRLNAAEIGKLENVGKMLDILEVRATK